MTTERGEAELAATASARDYESQPLVDTPSDLVERPDWPSSSGAVTLTWRKRTDSDGSCAVPRVRSHTMVRTFSVKAPAPPAPARVKSGNPASGGLTRRDGTDGGATVALGPVLELPDDDHRSAVLEPRSPCPPRARSAAELRSPTAPHRQLDLAPPRSAASQVAAGAGLDRAVLFPS
jgi:hypothetical protein